jgi:YVTN family beta-propeller protein
MTRSFDEDASPVWDRASLPSLSARIRKFSARIDRRSLRTLAVIPVVTLVAAFVASVAGARPSPAAETTPHGWNKLAINHFDPATWKPTADQPLPAMQSPITFKLGDEPAYWFDNGRPDLERVLHTRSLGVSEGPTTVKFSIGEPFTSVQHTFTSLVWPEGAENMPFKQPGGETGDHEVKLVTPGLYAFYCTIHPYMLGAVLVDDPATPGADFGKKFHWLDGTVIPTAADEVMKTVHSFFIITEPNNWQNYAADKDTKWDPQYPAAPILTYKEDGSPNLIPNLNDHFHKSFEEPKTLKPPVHPTTPGVGTVYYDAQWEGSAHKSKWGSITAIDADTWKIKSKWFGPSVNLNHPHNYWTDHDGKFLYTTNWFGNSLTVFDRQTGAVLRNVEVGPSPSHVMTRSSNDDVMVAINGGGKVVELDPGGFKVIKSYMTQERGQNAAQPHGFWVSGDGSHVVTPNANEPTASVIDMNMQSMFKPAMGPGQVAASITNDGKRAYIATLWDHTLTCVSIKEPACPTPTGEIRATYPIDLRQNYNKITGESKGPFGLVPIQTPISPDDHVMLTVGTVTGNIVVTDVRTNKIVKTLPCGPGCHGINFGAKKGGGYYGYVTIKFANKMVVVDPDPDGNGDLSDAKVAGDVLVNPEPDTQMDDQPTKYVGQGGNGIELYPPVYNGWVQKLPESEKAKLTCKQREPLSAALC